MVKGLFLLFSQGTEDCQNLRYEKSGYLESDKSPFFSHP